jgi:hypothetical protein
VEVKSSGGLRFSLLVEGVDLHATLLATWGLSPMVDIGAVAFVSVIVIR